MRRLLIAVFAASLVASVAALAPLTPAGAALPHVTLIGDSTLLGLQLRPQAQGALRAAYNVDMQAASCRRLVIMSCGSTVQPPNTLDVMKAKAGTLGEALVIMAGYDDWDIAGAIDTIMAEAHRQGLNEVLWLTYREDVTYVGSGGLSFSAVYQQSNAALRAKAASDPVLRLADWNAYSAGHPEWFAADGIHMSSDGAPVLAQFIRDQLNAQPLGRCRTELATGTPIAAPAAGAVQQRPLAEFTPADPVRVLDTRADDTDSFESPLGGGRFLKVDLRAGGFVGADATSAVVNLTSAGPCTDGFLTAYPCSTSVPLSSSVNMAAGRNAANLAVVMLDSSGAFCIFSSTQTDVVVDLFGSFGASGDDGFHPVTPSRLLDTRDGSGSVPLQGRPGVAATLTLAVRGRSGVPAGATAVALNLTATDATAGGFITAYPCGTRPVVSNLNFVPDRTVANMVIVPVAADGSVCLYTIGDSEIVADVIGWFGAGGSGYLAETPHRLLDSRNGTGPVPSGGSVTVPITGSGALLNITAVNGETSGFVTAYPCGTSRPLASNVNHGAGDVVANLAAVGNGQGGACIFAQRRVDLVVDAAGTFAS